MTPAIIETMEKILAAMKALRARDKAVEVDFQVAIDPRMDNPHLHVCLSVPPKDEALVQQIIRGT